MGHMERASVRDLHLKTSALMKNVAAGETYIIESRGVPVAELRALADEDHPTVRAANRYAHKKAARTVHAAIHAKAHYHNWKQRKGHKIRAWLNNH